MSFPFLIVIISQSNDRMFLSSETKKQQRESYALMIRVFSYIHAFHWRISKKNNYAYFLNKISLLYYLMVSKTVSWVSGNFPCGQTCLTLKFKLLSWMLLSFFIVLLRIHNKYLLAKQLLNWTWIRQKNGNEVKKIDTTSLN